MNHAARDRFFAQLAERPLVMGIINATPDSFSDGGHYNTLTACRERAKEQCKAGAAIVDIGGESTRPGANPVSAAEEKARVLPIIAAIAQDQPELPLSVDTYRADTAEQALLAGACVINDVWGAQKEPAIAEVAARHDCGLILMHNRQEPLVGYDLIAEMKEFFARSLAIAQRAGVKRERILLDPGIGFGKTFADNIAILARLGELRSLGLPLLVGLSRKRFIGEILAEPQADRRDHGSVGAHLHAVNSGANVIRVHDVRAHVQALACFETIARAQRTKVHG